MMAYTGPTRRRVNTSDIRARDAQRLQSRLNGQVLDECAALQRVIDTDDFTRMAYATNGMARTCRHDHGNDLCGFALKKSEEARGRCAIHAEFGALAVLNHDPDELYYGAAIIETELRPRLEQLKGPKP